MAEKAVTGYRRHTLVWISGEGRRQALRTARVLTPGVDDSAVAALLLDDVVPAIVRRQENPAPGCLQVGFSSAQRYGNTRLRVDAEILINVVERQMEPWQVARQATADFPFHRALATLTEAGESRGLRVGVYGSAALQIVTGRPYLRPDSDLDLYLTHLEANPDIQGFYENMLQLEEAFGLRVDAELEIAGFGVKLREYMAGGTTVLGKGFDRVALLRRWPDGRLEELPDN